MSSQPFYMPIKTVSLRIILLLLLLLLGVTIARSPVSSVQALTFPSVQVIHEGSPLIGFSGVALSPDSQTLYVGDAYADAIFALPSSGGALSQINVGTLGSPTGLAVSPDGTVIYANLSLRGLAAAHPVIVSLPASGGSATVVANLPATPGGSGGLAIYPGGVTLIAAPNYPSMRLYRIVIAHGAPSIVYLPAEGGDYIADVRVSSSSRWYYLGADGSDRLLKLSNDGGVPTPIFTGVPFVDPVNIALSPNEQMLYVLDPNIRLDETGHIVEYSAGWPGAIFAGPVSGGQFSLLFAGLSEFGLNGRFTVSPDGKTLYFGGLRRSTNAPVILSIPLLPTTFEVTSTADPGDGVCNLSECTLREAVVAANNTPGPNSIIVPAGMYVMNMPQVGDDNALTGDLDITGDVVIEGDKASNTIIDANRLSRVFQIAQNVTVKLKDLTIQNGFSGDGGGILNDGTLYLINSTVAHNSTHYDLPEPGGNVGGGIYNRGILYLSGTLMTGNSTDQDMGDGGGGAIMNVGTLTIAKSDFRQNWAAGGGAIYNAGGELTVTDCKLFNNTARFFGGAVENVFGGNANISRCTISGNNDSIYNDSGGTLLLENSTVTHNVAYRVAGGINNWGGSVQVINSTISYNSGNNDAAGGIVSYGTMTLAHSIVAHNSSADCGNTISSLGYNLDSDGSCGLAGIGDLTADPILGPLQNNGGPTPTQALLPGSPAIDVIPAGFCLSSQDQRYMLRPQDGDGDNIPACDIGAFELRR